MSERPATTASARAQGKPEVARIAAGVDGYAEGRDAAALGATLARATGAELLLVAIHPVPVLPTLLDSGWRALHKQAEAVLRKTRDELAPGARTHVEVDWSIPRALARVVQRQHRDLLVVGSSRHAPRGQVRIGKRTRQLLDQSQCALAIAPRGLSEIKPQRLQRIGVGYDGGAESAAALGVAGVIAAAGGAHVSVCGVIDDRIPSVSWGIAEALALADWDEIIDQQAGSLREQAERAAQAIDADTEIEILRGRPGDALQKLSRDVDLLVVGSRRWGAIARLMLGSTGEALMHGANCPVLVVPRPQAQYA